MRKIEVRAWNKVKSQMYYADYGKGTFETNSKWWGINQDENSAVNCTNGVLMQYTGLKDKNGRKIYEGDILKHYSLTEQMQKDLLHQIIGKVVIEKGMTYIIGKMNNGYIDEEIKTTNYKALLLSPELFEIIGNIFKNPELLEV